MPRSRVTLLLALLALLALAPAARADRVAGTSYVISTPEGAVYDFALRDAKTGLRDIAAYERAHVGVVVTQPTDVRLVPDDRCGSEIPTRDPRAGAMTQDHTICVYTGLWDFPGSAADRRFTLAHEAVHVLQAELGCLRAPLWFVEGMANLLGERAVKTPDRLESTLVTGLDQFVKGIGLSATGLRSHERTMGDLSDAEAERAVAALDLGDPRRLVTFCRAVGAGTDWPAAFGAAFHESINHFYTRFARIRAHIEKIPAGLVR
jgi:hypothetical protein